MPLFKKSDTVGLLCRPTVKAAVPAAVISRANTMRTLGALADFGALKSESIAALCFSGPSLFARASHGAAEAQKSCCVETSHSQARRAWHAIVGAVHGRCRVGGRPGRLRAKSGRRNLQSSPFRLPVLDFQTGDPRIRLLFRACLHS